MGYSERKKLYSDIEKERGRPLISFVTSTRMNATGSIASDLIPHFMRQLSALKTEEEEKIDFLIVSNGGDPTVAWRIITLIREHFNHVSVLLPDSAYSAATLLALGADDVVMHSFANLGPVDPQIEYVSNDGNRDRSFSFAAEDLRHFIDFVKEDVGISDQAQLESAFEFACRELGPTQIGFAKRSSHLSLSLGEKLLRQHMDDQNEASAIAEALSKSFYHHGHPVSRSEAKDIGLPVTDASDPERELMRQVWEDFEVEMKCREPFNPMNVVLSSKEGKNLLKATKQINIPAGIDQQNQQQLLNYLLKQVEIVDIEPVDYSMFLAAVESTRCKSQFRQNGKIFAHRLPSNQIHLNNITVDARWIFDSHD